MDRSEQWIDVTVLSRGDPEAVSTATGHYADLVYGTCRRVLGNAEAADVAQETFFEFAMSAEQIRGSLGGWLHRVATRRAIDLIRQNATRRRRLGDTNRV